MDPDYRNAEDPTMLQFEEYLRRLAVQAYARECIDYYSDADPDPVEPIEDDETEREL